jgi:ubiquitin C-terminal hydrolase
MFATPYFAETALAQKYPANSFGMALSRMFERMFVKSDASIDHMVAYGNDVRKSIVTTSSGQLPFRAQGQEDPSEYLYAFFASDPTIERIMHHFFQLSITEVVTCPNPKQSRTLMTTSNITFQLQIPTGASTLGACLADYFAEEDLEYPTYNESKRSGCSLCKQAVIHRRKHALVNPLPQHLIIFLKRFINPRKKDTRLINYPDSGLDLRAYLQPSDVRTNDGGIYELYAVCLHSSETGSASSGHYTARIRVPKTNEWYLMDDAAPPKPLDYSEARKSHSDAYALFYTRRP